MPAMKAMDTEDVVPKFHYLPPPPGSVTCALPVIVISNQASERAHRKDIYTNTTTHLLKEPMPNSALMHRGHYLNN